MPEHAGVPGQPTDAELATMTREQLVDLGGRIDGVETILKEPPRWPVEGTKAEKRAARVVSIWLLLGGLFGLALLLVFLFWPWQWDGSNERSLSELATPLYGLTFGMSILAIGIGAVLYQKKFIPRGDLGPGAPRRGGLPGDRAQDRRRQPDRRTRGLDDQAAQAGWAVARDRARRVRRGQLVAFIGGLIKNPWKPVVPTAEGKKAVLWTSGGWTPAVHRRDDLPGAGHRPAGRVALREVAARGHRRRRHGNGLPVA